MNEKNIVATKSLSGSSFTIHSHWKWVGKGGGGVKIKKTSASIQDMEQKSYVTERQFLALFTQIEKFSGYGKEHLLLLPAPHN